MKKLLLITTMGLFGSTTAFAVWDIELVGFFATIDATVAVCSKVAPESVATGLALMDKRLTSSEKKVAIEAKGTPSYQKTYDEEVLRLNAMDQKHLKTVCAQAW